MKGFYPGFELKGKTETVVFWQVANLLLWFWAYPFCLSVRHVLIIASIGRDSEVSILLVCFVTDVCLSSFQACGALVKFCALSYLFNWDIVGRSVGRWVSMVAYASSSLHGSVI